MIDRPLAVVLANFKSKWNPGWNVTRHHQIGSKDRFLLLNSSTGDAHLRNITYYKRIEDTPIWEIDAGIGTDKALFFDNSGNSFLMFGNSTTSKVKIFPLDSDAKLGNVTFESTLFKGWDNMEIYTIAGGKVFLVLIKSATGDIQIHELNVDGIVGNKTFDSRIDGEWKIARTYFVGPKVFLFLLNPGNGLVQIHELNASGKIERQVEDYDWSSGWTVASFGSVGFDTILFLLKTSNGVVHMHKMQNDGKVGARTYTRDWSSGWDSATFYYKGSTPCISLLKSSDGSGHLHEINSDGSVGTRINPKEPFTKEFAEIQFTQLGNGHNLLVDYFKDISRGREGLIPLFVTEWLTIQDSWENVKRKSRLNKAKAGFEEAKSKGYSFAKDQSVVVYHSQPGGSNAIGRFVLAHPHTMSLEFMAHEILHTWGQGHAFSDDSSVKHPWDNPIYWGVYDDPWDIMSAMGAYGDERPQNKSVGPGMCIFSLDQMGWLNEHCTTHIQAGAPVEEHTIKSLSIRMNRRQNNLKIHYGQGEFYTVEYRTKDEWDTGIPNDTVLIHRVEPFFTTRYVAWKGNFGTNWDIFNVFRAGNKSYLLKYESDLGAFEINRISENGKLEERTNFGNINTNMTSFETYSIEANTYLFMISKDTGRAKVMNLTEDGRLDGDVEQHHWSSGWTTAKSYVVNGKSYLFLLKEATGEVHIHCIDNDGSIGAEVVRYNWSSGWSHVHFYYKGQDAFVLFYKTSNGKMHTHKMNTDGKVGTQLDSKTIEPGWTTIHSYGTSGTIICWLNSSNIYAHFQSVKPSGHLEIIPDKAKLRWSKGWTHAFGYGTTSGNYLFIYKRESGRCEIVLSSVSRVLRKRKSEDPDRGPIQEINENGVKIKVIESGRSDKTAVVKVE